MVSLFVESKLFLTSIAKNINLTRDNELYWKDLDQNTISELIVVKKATYCLMYVTFFYTHNDILSPYEHPVVAPQVMHFRQVPLRIMVMLPHSGQASPV